MCGNCDIQQPVEAKLEVFAPEKPQDRTVDRVALEAYLRTWLESVKPDLKFMDVTHTLKNGIYTRTGRVKAGEIILGAKHRGRNIFHLAKGKVAVWDNMNGFRVLAAPHSEISFPGIQRIGLVLEDIEGSNIFETEAQAVDEAEAAMIFPLAVPEDALSKIVWMIEENKLLLIQ